MAWNPNKVSANNAEGERSPEELEKINQELGQEAIAAVNDTEAQVAKEKAVKDKEIDDILAAYPAKGKIGNGAESQGGSNLDVEGILNEYPGEQASTDGIDGILAEHPFEGQADVTENDAMSSDDVSPVSGEQGDESMAGLAIENTETKMTVASIDALLMTLDSNNPQDEALKDLLLQKRDALMNASEAGDENAESAEDGEREERVKNIGEKLKKEQRGLKGFLRFAGRKVVAVGAALLTALSMLGGTSHAAGEGDNGVEKIFGPTTAITVEDGSYGGESDSLTTEQALQYIEDLGVSLEDFENSGDVDFEGLDLQEMGEKILESMENREGTQKLPNGVMGNLEDYKKENWEKGTNNFGTSVEWLFDSDEDTRNSDTAQALLETLRDKPQTLSAFAAHFPSIMKVCDVSEGIIENEDIVQRANGILDELMTSEDGGALQKKLLAACGIALLNENTNYDFYKENGLERSFYMMREDANDFDDLNNIVLGLDTVQRDGTKQLQITITFKDGHQETIDLNLPCGFQPNLLVNRPTSPEPVTPVTPPVTTAPPVTTPPTTTTTTVETTTITTTSTTPETTTTTPETTTVTTTSTTPETTTTTPETTVVTTTSTTPETTTTTPETTTIVTTSTTPETTTTTPETTTVVTTTTTPETTTLKPKDPDNEIKIVESGGQSNPVGQTGNLDDKVPGVIEKPSNETPENRIPQEDIVGNLTGTYDKTEETTVIPDAKAEEIVAGNQVPDKTVSSEQQAINQANQEAADAAVKREDLSKMTDDEFIKYVNSI